MHIAQFALAAPFSVVCRFEPFAATRLDAIEHSNAKGDIPLRQFFLKISSILYNDERLLDGSGASVRRVARLHSAWD